MSRYLSDVAIPDGQNVYYNALGQPVSRSGETNLSRHINPFGMDIQNSFAARVGSNGIADAASEIAAFQALLVEIGKLQLNDTCKQRVQAIAAQAIVTQKIPQPGTPDGDWIAMLRSGKVPADCQAPGTTNGGGSGDDGGFPWWIVAVAGGGLIIYLLAK